MKNKSYIFISVIGLILIALNLRAPITSISPILDNIENAVNITSTTASLLMSIPLLIFAVLSPFIFSLTKRKSLESSIIISVLLIMIGIGLRAHMNIYTLFLGTIIISIGITISNVIMPVFIKQKFPNNISTMISIYGLMMGLGSWISISSMIPIMNLTHHFSLSKNSSIEISLLSAILFAIIALIVWLPQHKNKTILSDTKASANLHSHIWKSRIAWEITIFLAGNSVLMYIFSTWLPDILKNHGYSIESSGYLAGLFQIASCLPIFIIVPLMKILKNKNIITLILALCTLVGIILIMLNILNPFAIVLIGIGIGGNFMISLMLIGIRTHDTHLATVLSGMSQSIAYLLAALGPFITGLCYRITMSWNTALIVCTAITISIVFFSLFVADKSVIKIND